MENLTTDHTNISFELPTPSTPLTPEEEVCTLTYTYTQCRTYVWGELQTKTPNELSSEEKTHLFFTIRKTLLPTLQRLKEVKNILRDSRNVSQIFSETYKTTIADYLDLYRKLKGPFTYQSWLLEFEIEFSYYLNRVNQANITKARALLTEYEEKLLSPLRDLVNENPKYEQDLVYYEAYFDLLLQRSRAAAYYIESEELDVAKQALQESGETQDTTLSRVLDLVRLNTNISLERAEYKMGEASQKVEPPLFRFAKETPALFLIWEKSPIPPSFEPPGPLTPLEAFDYYLGKSPTRRWCRFFIDQDVFSRRPIEEKLSIPAHLVFDTERNVHTKNKMDGEPGYFEAMCNAFSYIRETLGERFDARHFELLHHKCVAKVGGLPEDVSEIGVKGELRYGVKWHDITEEAKKEWEKERLIYDPESSSYPRSEYLSYLDREVYTIFEEGKTVLLGGQLLPFVCREHSSKEAVCNEINRLFDRYYTTVKTSQQQTFEAIVNLCRRLEILHAFKDGNQRTIAFALLTKLLLENGYSPAILEKPSMFDGYYSTAEMVEKVKKGIGYYLRHEH